MLLTVDIGTSNFKAAVWDFEGNSIAFASSPLSITLRKEGFHEADSGQWLRAFEDCCRSLGREVQLSAVEAVVISGNGPSLVPVLGNNTSTPLRGVDERSQHVPAPKKSTAYSNGKPPLGGVGAAGGLHAVPTAPARLWLDRRAVKAAEQVSELMGGFVDASFFLPKALDIKINEPQLYEKTKYFLGCPELLAFALSGEARTVFPSDGFDRWFWTDSILERLDLDKEKFPPFIRPGEIYGRLAPHIADHFGFKPDIPVISGGPDFFAAILGSGTVKPEQVCDRAGTSEGINACTELRIDDKRLMSYRHPVKPFWNLSGIVSTTGKAIEWGCDFLGVSYDDFFALAETAPAGSGGLVFLPYLAGERAPVWNPLARGILRGLSLSAGRAEFARVVLEGICFAIRDVITVMESASAVVDELRVAGTLSCSDRLNQMKADITQKPVLVPRQKEAELLGLAIIGSCTMGKFPSFASAAQAFVRIEKTYQPDRTNIALYDNLFKEYRKTKEHFP
jgi:xylulokinase